jgi:hypothetical protein
MLYRSRQWSATEACNDGKWLVGLGTTVEGLKGLLHEMVGSLLQQEALIRFGVRKQRETEKLRASDGAWHLHLMVPSTRVCRNRLVPAETGL